MAAQAEEEGWLRGRDGTSLFWRAWTVTQPRFAVAVAHGLGEHSGRYSRLGRALNRRGISCYAVDLRGMGRSAGRRGHLKAWSDWIDDCADFLALARERAGNCEVVPLGHSFGGVLVASAVLREDVQARRFVLSNPAFLPKVRVPAWKLRLAAAASRLVPRLTMSNEVEPEVISRDPEQMRLYAEDPLTHDRISARLYTEWRAACADTLGRASELKQPFLLILSGDDRLIDANGAEAFNAAASCGQVVRRYPGRFHEPFNDYGSEEVFADLALWLNTPVPARPQ
ncbi:MAG: lysophospholipase [Candidatus Dormibacteraeota bacterium]|nr:lysophospholipase [Candidatus Dormibacteraeota bacterium]